MSEFILGQPLDNQVSTELREQILPGMNGIILEYKKSLLIPLFIAAYDKPSAKEIEVLRKGQIKIHLADLLGTMWFSVEMGDGTTMDCPYSPSLYSQEERPDITPEHFQPDKRMTFNWIGVDSRDMIVTAVRMFTVNHRFSVAFAKLLQEKANLSISRQAHRVAIDKVFAAYTTKDIIKKSHVYSHAGD